MEKAYNAATFCEFVRAAVGKAVPEVCVCSTRERGDIAKAAPERGDCRGCIQGPFFNLSTTSTIHRDSPPPPSARGEQGGCEACRKGSKLDVFAEL